MENLSWLPNQLAQLTIWQLVCLMNSRPPGRERIETSAEYEQLAAAEAAAEAAWKGT